MGPLLSTLPLNKDPTTRGLGFRCSEPFEVRLGKTVVAGGFVGPKEEDGETRPVVMCQERSGMFAESGSAGPNAMQCRKGGRQEQRRARAIDGSEKGEIRKSLVPIPGGEGRGALH